MPGIGIYIGVGNSKDSAGTPIPPGLVTADSNTVTADSNITTADGGTI